MFKSLLEKYDFLGKCYQIYLSTMSPEGSLFVYAFSYSLLLGLAPFLIISVMVIGNFVFSVDQIVGLLTQYVPANLIQPFIDYILINNFDSLGALLTILGASVWVASKSIHSFLLNSSVRDKVKVNGIMLRVFSLLYFLLIVGVIIGSGIVISVFDVPTALVIPLILVVFFYIFYWLLSFRKIQVKELIMGSLFSTLAIALVGQLFFVIINRFFNYDTIYGPFASVMVLLLSLYIISTIIYIGYLITNVYRDPNAPLKRGLIGRVAK